MDKSDMVWAKATSKGQLPNKMWVDEDSPAFQIERSKASERWMKPANDPAKKGKAKAPPKASGPEGD